MSTVHGAFGELAQAMMKDDDPEFQRKMEAVGTKAAGTAANLLVSSHLGHAAGWAAGQAAKSAVGSNSGVARAIGAHATSGAVVLGASVASIGLAFGIVAVAPFALAYWGVRKLTGLGK